LVVERFSQLLSCYEVVLKERFAQFRRHSSTYASAPNRRGAFSVLGARVANSEVEAPS
jgi:hypothetical protein